MHRVTLNLPRLAYRTGNEDALYAALGEAVGCVVQAHLEKRRFIERLLSFKELGTLSLFAEEFEGRCLLDPDRAVFEVGVTGLNECVQALLGVELHESDDAMALGERIVTRLNQECDRQGEIERLRLIPAQVDDDAVTRRFAVADAQQFTGQASPVVKFDPVTQDMYYTAGVQLAKTAPMTPLERVSLEGRLHDAAPADAVSRVDLGETAISTAAIASLIRRAYHRTRARQILLAR
jgi:ribonucleoside-triphosphate reductase